MFWKHCCERLFHVLEQKLVVKYVDFSGVDAFYVRVLKYQLGWVDVKHVAGRVFNQKLFDYHIQTFAKRSNDYLFQIGLFVGLHINGLAVNGHFIREIIQFDNQFILLDLECVFFEFQFVIINFEGLNKIIIF